ncbi:TrmH family RNA methyltransferase [Aquabacterium sp. J223]|uniref:TrmH family RNA methyltransferase n=1 Tax=Aquabacterium sp. J223 TaxID=2898431 RepID=UPI0021AE280F|nr:RNA methyltransferase [Aquabacterium sp. J223]UUX97044.1 RNA methyltransferase [Aquabacterium sp. J223]
MTGQPLDIRSRDNPLVVALKKLAQDSAGYRRQQAVWLEGDHLLAAALQRGVEPDTAVITESAWEQRPDLRALARRCGRVVRLPEALMAAISGLPSPPPIGARLALPAAVRIDPAAATVVLDRLQDAGNVGSILRSAAAFGVGQVLALKGTAALWSPKVLRAGMGAHFGLRLVEGLSVDDLAALQVPLVATSSHAGAALGSVPLPRPCAWVLGHEGQGVQPGVTARCALTLRIPQPGGEESLNVAAAAAVCLYESSLSR